MCGVAGVFNYRDRQPVDEKLLDRMTDLLAYRGPDGRGTFIDGHVGLGHRRLAIVDLSDAGKQPMQCDGGQVVISYNGETYNHMELRPELESDGVRFRGHSDTETIIHLYAKFGAAAFAKLTGIFAFALWDQRQQALYLVRDPLGVKQIYYWTDDRSLLFASEAKAVLLQRNVGREADIEAIGEYLHFHTTVQEKTFFSGIRVVLPGELLRIDGRGVQRWRYTSGDDYSPLELPQREAAQLVERTLSSVIRSQLMSDVPVGCFVSGGIDSSIVANYASRFISSGQMSGFGCYYRGSGVLDEEPYAKEAARAAGVELKSVHPTGDDFNALFARALWHQDEPKIGAAMLSMWKVAQLAARDVKVCLGGQGADELFGGYARYALARPVQLIAGAVRNRLTSSHASSATVHRQVSRGDNRRRLLKLINPFHGWRRRYFDTLAQISRRRLRSLFNEEKVYDRGRYRERFNDIVERCASSDPMDRVMYWDRVAYLPGLFVQDDRMSMAHGLETRVPFADPRVVRMALRIPNQWKMNGFTSKWILKQALHDVLPAWVINRQKAGFDTPIGKWCAGSGYELVRDLLGGRVTKERGLFNTRAALELLERPVQGVAETIVWKLINIEQWFRLFIDTPASN